MWLLCIHWKTKIRYFVLQTEIALFPNPALLIHFLYMECEDAMSTGNFSRFAMTWIFNHYVQLRSQQHQK